MKNLKNMVIIYDDECPMCEWYTCLFTRNGLLPANGRIKFSEIATDELQHIDLKRGHNEIPLYDSKTKEVMYGVDAWTFLLNNRWSIFGNLMKLKVVRYIMTMIYKFISYNRKVITGMTSPTGAYNCKPDFNLKYRVAFIIVGVYLFYLAIHQLLLNLKYSVDTLLILGLLLFIISLCLLFPVRGNREDRFNNAGQCATLYIIAALCLFPFILLSHYAFNDFALYVGCLIAALAVMISLKKRLAYSHTQVSKKLLL